MGQRKWWIVLTEDELDEWSGEPSSHERLYPGDWTAQQVAIAYAEKYDIGCSNRPMLYEGVALTVCVHDAESYEKDCSEFQRFTVKGRLDPYYFVEEDA